MYCSQLAMFGATTNHSNAMTIARTSNIFHARANRPMNESIERSISSTCGFGRSVAVLIGTPLHIYSRGFGPRPAQGSFNLEDFAIGPHGEHEEDLIGYARLIKATARDDVEEVAVTILQRVSADEGHAFVACAILLGLVETLLQRLLGTSLAFHRLDCLRIQRLPHQVGVEARHAFDVLIDSRRGSSWR